MTLIVIVASLLLERMVGQWQHLRRMEWFARYRRWLFGVAPENWGDGLPGVMLVLLPVLIAMLLVHWAVHGAVFGLMELLLSVAVVTYCLGPESFNERIDAYLDACEAHDRDEARRIAESLVGGPVSENLHQQSQSVATAVLYEGNMRIFAVLFWFMLIGPAGALLYRCAAFLAGEAATLEKPRLARAAEQTFAVLDWAPARLLSLSFFLAGSFDDAMHAWRRVTAAEQDLAESNRSVVIVTGCGAMRHDVDDAFDESEHGDAYDLYWVRAARGLVLRSVVVWVTVVALLTMAGWFV